MKLDPEFFHRPAGQFLVVGVVVTLCGGALLWQYHQKHADRLPEAKTVAPVSLPRIFARDGVRISPPKQAQSPLPTPPAPAVGLLPNPAKAKPESKAPILPLTLFTGDIRPEKISAPYGRLIPCETVTTLESNRLDTPVIGLVTENVWQGGRIVIPVGTEVHGRAALDRQRERLAVAGPWMLVWRHSGPDSGRELGVQGLALDRGGETDGSAGLRGEVLRTDRERELKLFATTFLSTATLALQNVRTSAGPLGESVLPAVTARNATLAGTAAVLREYADQLRAAIARDGFYLRVPAGTPFYLYVTETLNRSRLAPVQP